MLSLVPSTWHSPKFGSAQCAPCVPALLSVNYLILSQALLSVQSFNTRQTVNNSQLVTYRSPPCVHGLLIVMLWHLAKLARAHQMPPCAIFVKCSSFDTWQSMPEVTRLRHVSFLPTVFGKNTWQSYTSIFFCFHYGNFTSVQLYLAHSKVHQAQQYRTC